MQQYSISEHGVKCDDKGMRIAEHANGGESSALAQEMFTLEYLSPFGGSIDSNCLQRVKRADSAATVTAVADDAHEFYMWSDGVSDATRTDVCVQSDKTVTAVFRRKKVCVRYEVRDAELGFVVDANGDLVRSLVYEIAYGEDAPVVSAVPKRNYLDEEYTFLFWSDGSTARKRRDKKLTEDCTVTAYFGYKVEYCASAGGKVVGNLKQTLLPDEDGEDVRAVADEGYAFAGWSNLTAAETTRVIPSREMGLCGLRNMRIKAYFEPVCKTFYYDLCFPDAGPVSSITLDRRNIASATFMVPQREGYSFCGWYADKRYRIKIANETGRYLYGYAAFALKSDKLYAKWRKNDSKVVYHKILMVFVDKIKAVLYSDRLGECVRSDYKMTALDYELSRWCAATLYKLLNNWFAGRVRFEVDSYYTTRTVTGGFENGINGLGRQDYFLFADRVDEVAELTPEYSNTLTVAGCRDYVGYLFGSAGSATAGHACVIADDEWFLPLLCNISPDEHIKALKQGRIRLDRTLIETCLHELIHTAELQYHLSVGLHSAIKFATRRYGRSNIVNTLKPYLLGNFGIDGFLCGIPSIHWKH